MDSLATVGSYQSLPIPSLAAGNIVIDDNNDNFSMSLNGIAADITLSQGTYTTAAELAAQIQQQINSDSTYEGGNHSVSVTYDSVAKRFDLASNIYGKNSEISFSATDSSVANTLGFTLASQGPFQGNQLAGLATATGLSSENFTTAVTIDSDTSFSLAIDGVSTSLMTIPGTSGAPVTYNTPDDLIAAINTQLTADGAFLAKPAGTVGGDTLLADMDFSIANRSLTFSVDGGSTEIEVLVTGDSSSVAFGGQTPGTLANSLAAVQDAIDGTALNGVVVASLDANDKIVFTTVATGAAASLELVKDGTSAVVTGGSALNVAGFDFASTNATFTISIDGETDINLTIDTLSTDRADTVQQVQNALIAGGIGTRVTASLDGSNQLVLNRSDDTGTSTRISITNVNATAAAELGFADADISGLDGFGYGVGTSTGVDAKIVTVAYAYDSSSQLGRFVFSTDDNADVLEFDLVSTDASNKLGIFIGDGTYTTAITGLDVTGKINGITAVGSGQLLRAGSGNVPAKPGFFLNVAFGNLASSTTNDKFKITIGGITSTDITLGTISDTDPDAVATSLAATINANPTLLAAGVGVTVEYDAVTGGFGIISKTTGITSNVTISELTGSTASIFGFVTGAGAKGQNGSKSQGVADLSANIRVRIKGGALGARGTVSFIRGIADQLDKLVDSYLGNTGLLSNRTDSLNKELAGIEEDRVSLAARLEASEQRLRESFLANDLIISSLNITADFLTAQLSLKEGLMGSTRNKK